MKTFRHVLKQIAVSADQLFLNCILFCWLPGGVWADETFSSRCWRMRHTRPFTWLQPLVDRLFFWQENHCESSYLAELLRGHEPPRLRNRRDDSYGIIQHQKKGKNNGTTME